MKVYLCPKCGQGDFFVITHNDKKIYQCMICGEESQEDEMQTVQIVVGQILPKGKKYC